MNKAKQHKLISEFISAKLDPEIKTLLGSANHDLYYGPCVDNEDYPGFEEACQKITSELEISRLWLDTQSEEILDSEPKGFEDEDGTWIEPEDYIEFSREEVMRICFGELAPYLR